MPIDQKIRDKVIVEGFYEEKIPDPSEKWPQRYRHRAYAKAANETIVSYDAFVNSKNIAPVVFFYSRLNAETGEGFGGTFFSSRYKKPLPYIINKNYDEATKFIHDENSSPQISLHKSLPIKMRNNFGDIGKVIAASQSTYFNFFKLGDSVYGVNLGFMIGCKNDLINAKQQYSATHSQVNNIDRRLIA